MTDNNAGEEQPVLTERRGNVLLITLNRPAVRNAVNAALAAGVAGALEELDSDESLSVGVLTGAGGFFSAGMDLGAFVRGESPWFGDRGFAGIAQRSAREAPDRGDRGVRPCGRHGDRLGVRSDRGRQGGQTRHPRGQTLAGRGRGALLRMPRRMPYHVVMELALTGDPLPAERFEEFGLVNHLAEPGVGARRGARAGRRGSPATGRSP